MKRSLHVIRARKKFSGCTLRIHFCLCR